MNLKKILYIEANLDGTVGGSHHCLLEMVKYINREKYLPSVLFYQENSLVQEFRSISDVYIFNQNEGLIIEKDLPELYDIINNRKYIKKAVLFCQKIYNFFAYYIQYLITICKFLKTHKFDLIHANNSPDLTEWLILSKILKVKIISHLRFPWSPNRTRKLLFGYYDKIISISNYVANQLKELDIPCEKVETIYDGIDININHKAYNSKDLLNELGIPMNAPIIGVIGNIRRWKGQHVAIDAMNYVAKKNKDARCLIVGEISSSESDVEYLRYLKDLVKNYNLENNVYFTGYRKDIYNVLYNLDILVHTSIFPEPLGRVIFEGMTFRKPVIATNHGGPMETIEDGVSGFLVPPENPLLLSEKILFLLENKGFSNMLGENGRMRVEEKFSINGNIMKIEKIYASLLEK